MAGWVILSFFHIINLSFLVLFICQIEHHG